MSSSISSDHPQVSVTFQAVQEPLRWRLAADHSALTAAFTLQPPAAPAGLWPAALAQRDIAAAMGVSVARLSQIEHSEVTSLRPSHLVEALCGRLDPVAGRTARLPVSDTVPTAAT
jgi:hypothetical protein